jgi:hypothetical protein
MFLWQKKKVPPNQEQGQRHVFHTGHVLFSLSKSFKVGSSKKFMPNEQSKGRKLKEEKYLNSFLIFDLYFVA